MSETTVDDLRAELRQLMQRTPAGLGDLGRDRVIRFKDMAAEAQRLLKQPRPSAAGLRSIINELRAYYGQSISMM
jgi:hypothetical protein